MFNRCKHKWEVVDRKFNPPTVVVKRTYGSNLSFDERCIVYGYTQISLRCEDCALPKTDRLVGEWNAGS